MPRSSAAAKGRPEAAMVTSRSPLPAGAHADVAAAEIDAGAAAAPASPLGVKATSAPSWHAAPIAHASTASPAAVLAPFELTSACKLARRHDLRTARSELIAKPHARQDERDRRACHLLAAVRREAEPRRECPPLVLPLRRRER